MFKNSFNILRLVTYTTLSIGKLSTISQTKKRCIRPNLAKCNVFYLVGKFSKFLTMFSKADRKTEDLYFFLSKGTINFNSLISSLTPSRFVRLGLSVSDFGIVSIGGNVRTI